MFDDHKLVKCNRKCYILTKFDYVYQLTTNIELKIFKLMKIWKKYSKILLTYYCLKEKIRNCFQTD